MTTKEDTSFVEFDGNIALARINDLDTSKEIGGINVLYYLKVERVSDKNIVMAVWSSGMLTMAESCSLSDMGYKITSKRTPMIKDLITLFGGEELPISVNQKLRAACRIIQEKWLGSDSTDSMVSIPRGHTEIKLSDLEREEAIRFLKDPNNLDVIREELDRAIAGEDTTKVYTWLKILQSYTPYFCQIQLCAMPDVGKTTMIEAGLDLHPPEYIEPVTEISPTALRRTDFTGKRILYFKQSYGFQNSQYHIMMLSRDDQRESYCIITDKETGKTDKVQLPKNLGLITSSINVRIEKKERNSRTDRIFLDDSKQQSERVGEFIAKSFEIPLQLKINLGLEKPSKRKLIQNSIRIMIEDCDMTVIIPYASYFERCLNKTKHQYKRFLKSFLGVVWTLTLWRKYNRQVYVDPMGAHYLIAEPEDLLDAVKYSLSHVTQTLFDVPEQERLLLEILEKLGKENPLMEGFVFVDKIAKAIRDDPQLRYEKSWTYEKLKFLSDNTGYLEKKWVETPSRGYVFRTVSCAPNSIFDTSLDKAKLLEISEMWKNKMIQSGGKINVYPRGMESAESVECPINSQEPLLPSDPSEPSETSDTEPWYKVIPKLPPDEKVCDSPDS